jgi:release factor glutamine methyltransferase
LSEDALISMDLDCGEDDWTPTPHGILLGDVIAGSEFAAGKDILELGAGVGNHTVLLVRKGARSVLATEITDARVATAKRNVEKNCGADAPVKFAVADWLALDGEFDLLVTNPPFARSGERNRRYFIDALILRASRVLRERGEVLFVQSSMADLAKSLRRLDENGFDARVIEQRSGPFRDYYFEDPSFMEEIQRVPDGFEIRDGTHYETLYVIHGTLRPWSAPASAH